MNGFMLSKIKYIKRNIENPNDGKRNANLDKVLIYRTAINKSQTMSRKVESNVVNNKA